MKLLEVKDLKKNIPEAFVLDGISFEVEEKGIYGFFGKKGQEKHFWHPCFAEFATPTPAIFVIKARAFSPLISRRRK